MKPKKKSAKPTPQPVGLGETETFGGGEFFRVVSTFIPGVKKQSFSEPVECVRYSEKKPRKRRG